MTSDLDDRQALQTYRQAVEELRAMALDVRHRIDDAEKAIAGAVAFVELQHRRARHAAEQRAAASAGTSSPAGGPT